MPTSKPNSPAEPRQGDKPAHIATHCPRCRTVLVLADRLREVESADSSVWHDEWICPVCRDRIYLDVPSPTV